VIIIALFKLYSELRVEGNALLLVEEPESFLHPTQIDIWQHFERFLWTTRCTSNNYNAFSSILA
jgi:predicted ATP-dependent endonuclease of OLD family